jgi:hypothetical protein
MDGNVPCASISSPRPPIPLLVEKCGQRGCDVAVVLESESDSGGKVTFEVAAALGSDVAAHATICLSERPDERYRATASRRNSRV